MYRYIKYVQFVSNLKSSERNILPNLELEQLNKIISV